MHSELPSLQHGCLSSYLILGTFRTQDYSDPGFRPFGPSLKTFRTQTFVLVQNIPTGKRNAALSNAIVIFKWLGRFCSNKTYLVKRCILYCRHIHLITLCLSVCHRFHRDITNSPTHSRGNKIFGKFYLCERQTQACNSNGTKFRKADSVT